jgi:glycine/sarcosine N-methyltransferase
LDYRIIGAQSKSLQLSHGLSPVATGCSLYTIGQLTSSVESASPRAERSRSKPHHHNRLSALCSPRHRHAGLCILENSIMHANTSHQQTGHQQKGLPLAARDTENYQQEYVQGFVDKWDELIDWDGRAASEGHFFIDQLREKGAKKILDVATGTGFHSVQLLEAGFEVTSVDGNPTMLAKAFDNARQRGHILRTVHADWRWLNRSVHDLYDAVICLGNSFTHLHDDNDRRKALAEFYATLRHDGILILDQRNYDALLDHKIQPTHNYYYCGDNVRAEPEHVDDGLARFRYSFPDGSIFHLNMFPLRKSYVNRLMREVGFQSVKTFGDFKETYRDTEPDFLIHVADKAYREDAS